MIQTLRHLVLSCLLLTATACGSSGSGGGGGGNEFPQTLTQVLPATGSTAGGTLVRLRGTGFTSSFHVIRQILFGETPAPTFTIVDDETIEVVTPPHARGAVAVFVRGDNAPEADGVLLVGGFGFVAPHLYVADGPGGAVTQLYDVDLTTGAVQPIGPLAIPIQGMSLAADGFLYGTEIGATRRLVRIDPASAVATAVALLKDASSGAPVEIVDTAFLDGRLLGRTTAGALVEIDTATGVVTTLAVPAGVPPGLGLGAALDGTLYLAPSGEPDRLYMQAGPAGVPAPGPFLSSPQEFDALVVAGDEIFGIVPNPGGAPALVRVDRTTGAVAPVGVLPTHAGALARAN